MNYLKLAMIIFCLLAICLLCQSCSKSEHKKFISEKEYNQQLIIRSLYYHGDAFKDLAMSVQSDYSLDDYFEQSESLN